MTIEEYRRRLGWSQSELSRRARLNQNTVRKAERGEEVSSATALAITEALSKALGERILVEDVDGLVINW